MKWVPMKLVHFTDGHELFPKRGIIIERAFGLVFVVHLVVGLKWPIRRWFVSDYERSVIHAKPMLWMRVSLARCIPDGYLFDGFPAIIQWLLGRFVMARGISAVDTDDRRSLRVGPVEREPVECEEEIAL
jgi:hypothetical protein